MAYSAESSSRSRNSGTTGLSWSHDVELRGIKDSDERSFYEIEATNSCWLLSELNRQKASCLYERLALVFYNRLPRHCRESSHRSRVRADESGLIGVNLRLICGCILGLL